MQPRPFDITPRDLARLSHCVATPKVDGCEAFCLVHMHGVALITRQGTVHCFPPGPHTHHRWPILLEGEILRKTGEEEEEEEDAAVTFIAYDCCLSPVVSYIQRAGRVGRIFFLFGLFDQACPPGDDTAPA